MIDYKKNSRVIIPRPQSAEKESKLEVERMELLEQLKKWFKENCNCKGEQLVNPMVEELKGLKSLRLRLKNGEIVILPMDKSGKFSVMSMKTYIITAGDMHLEGDCH